jgi:hypothetical protein
MPIYRMKFPGVDNVLFVRADSAAKAKDQVVTTEALTSDELVNAISEGLAVYKEGDSILGDDPTTAPDEATQSDENLAPDHDPATLDDPPPAPSRGRGRQTAEE